MTVNKWWKIAWVLLTAGVAVGAASGSAIVTVVGVPLVIGGYLLLFRDQGWRAVAGATAIAVVFLVTYFV